MPASIVKAKQQGGQAERQQHQATHESVLTGVGGTAKHG